MADNNNDVLQVSKIPSRGPSSVHDGIIHVVAQERVDLRDPRLHEKAIAEFSGTFMLVFTVGVAVASPWPPAPRYTRDFVPRSGLQLVDPGDLSGLQLVDPGDLSGLQLSDLQSDFEDVQVDM